MNRILSAFLLLAATPALAQSNPDRFERSLLQVASHSGSLEAFQALIPSQYLRFDIDGTPGISEADLRIAASIALTNVRLRYVTELLRYDLDGDFRITTDELRLFAAQEAARPLRSGHIEIAPTPAQVEMLTERIIADRLAPDTDGDGTISTAEIAALAGERADAQLARMQQTGPGPAFDTDGDGIITEAEFLDRATALYRQADTDGDGAVTPREASAAPRSQIMPGVIDLRINSGAP